MSSVVVVRIADWVGLGIFLIIGILISVLVETLHRERRQRQKSLVKLTHAEEVRHQAVEQTRRLLEFHEAVMKNMGEGLYTVDAEGLVIYMNPAAEALFGWTSAELQGRKMHEVTHYKRADGTSFPSDECEGLQVLRTGTALKEHEDVFVRKDGTLFDVVYTCSPIVWKNKIVGLVVVFRDVTERKRGEEALRYSDALKAAMLESSLDCIITMDHEGKVIEANPAVEKIFGYTREYMLGKEMASLIIPPSTREQHRQGLTRYLATGAGSVLGKRLELVAMRANGMEFPVEVAISPIRAPGPPKFTGYVRDITERKRAEEKFRLVVEAAPTGMVMVDREGKMLLVNAQTEKLFGYNRAELLEQPIELLIPARFRGGHRGHRAGFFAQPSPRAMGAGRDLFGLRKDGTEFPIEIGLNPIETEDGLLVMASIIDITERKRVENEIRRLNEELEKRVLERTREVISANIKLYEVDQRLRLLVESVKDYAIIMLDTNGCVSSWNTGAERIKGYGADEILGKHFSCFYVHEDIAAGKPVQNLERAATEGRFEHESWRVRKDGSRFLADVVITAIKDEADRLIGFSKVTRDITERKEAEEALHQRTEELVCINAELERFAYVSSHDLQEPLRMVSSYTKLLAKRYKGKLDADADEYIRYAVEGAERMSQLIKDLLAYSRIGARESKSEVVDCEEVLKRVLVDVKTAIDESGATLTHDTLPTVIGDPTQIGQLFQNLIGNALKFCNQKAPCVHISAKLRIEESGFSEWLFSVRDNGIGIEPEYGERIFQAFQRLHTKAEYPGSGIGLAICKKIVEGHGGRIWVESQPGEGSTFFFTLPAPRH